MHIDIALDIYMLRFIFCTMRGCMSYFTNKSSTPSNHRHTWILCVFAVEEIYARHVAYFRSIQDTVACNILERLAQLDQLHLLTKWDADPKINLERKRRFIEQVRRIDEFYPLQDYYRNAKILLKQSTENVNVYADYDPSPPPCISFMEDAKSSTDELYEQMEALGVANFATLGFVLVAGGVGERLGYSGIKVNLPIELVTGQNFLRFYCEYILAAQSYARKIANNPEIELPLLIMTSQQTHYPTLELLQEKGYYGLKPNQVTLLQQVDVPALVDIEARFTTREDDPYTLLTKPHGHGDVHLLLFHELDRLKTWQSSRGLKYLLFFQDTNSLALRALPALLGVSIANGFTMNTLGIPRTPEDAIGALCRLERKPGKQGVSLPDVLTINVEYNMLQGLFTTPEETYTRDGISYSRFPGNSNAFILKLDHYVEVLERTKGVIGEFVNPKYQDKTRTAFTTPTRLECMMQDIPKLFNAEYQVGVTLFDLWMAFNPVKNCIEAAIVKQARNNAAECAGTGEAMFYDWSRRVLRKIGVHVDTTPTSEAKCDKASSAPTVRPAVPPRLANVRVVPGPAIVLKPSFGLTRRAIAEHFPDPSKVTISADSVLVLGGQVTVKELHLNGYLCLEAEEGSSITVDVKGLAKNSSLRLADVPMEGVDLMTLRLGLMTPTTPVPSSSPNVVRGYTLEGDLDGLHRNGWHVLAHGDSSLRITALPFKQ